jgi:dTDP-glucose pyrophosphorylase
MKSNNYNNSIIKNKFLREFKIISSAPLSSAFEVLEKNKKGICLVCKNNKLQGILTDGDLRRLILKGINTKDKIHLYMNKKFFFLEKYNSKKIERFFFKKKINQVPILNKDKSLVGLVINNMQKIHKSNPVFFLAGGLGKRMGSLTLKVPKPMLIVNNKPILENQILNLKKKGFFNFIISVNYLSSKIIKYFGTGDKLKVNIDYIQEKFALGTAGSLSLLDYKSIQDDILVLNGDLIADLDYESILKDHVKKKSDVTICVKRYVHNLPYGVINKRDSQSIINEKPDLNFLINIGVYILKPNILSFLKKNQNCSMVEFLNILKKNKKKIKIFYVYESIFDVGDKSKYEEISNLKS